MRAADEICAFSLADLSELLVNRRVSVTEVLDSYSVRIDRIDPIVRAFITVTVDQARVDAVRLDKELAAGMPRGPLHGIPIALKDLFDTAGVRTTANSQVLEDRVPANDAAVVSRLRNAGALIVGKLKLHEFATAPVARDDYFPPAQNPWRLDCIPGGSSSGSAVALSAGLCAGSLGSDTGGSIRAPSAMVGVVGLKPTYDLVSRRGVIPLSWSLDHVGPMARTVRDVALLLDALVESSPSDSSGRERPKNYGLALDENVAGLRIGVPRALIEATGTTKPMYDAFNNAMTVMAGLGAELCEIELPLAEASDAIQSAIRGPELLACHRAWLMKRPGLYGKAARRRIVEALAYSVSDYLDGQRARRNLAHRFCDLFSSIDLLAMPTLPRTAPTFEEFEASGLPRPPLTGLFNLSGQPALSLPCGFDEKGLPMGLMFAARAFDELTVLRAAHAFESATTWCRLPPAVWED